MIPKITIGITTYNRPEYLLQAVGSVMGQSYRNFELIISNDYQCAPVSYLGLIGCNFDQRVRIVNQPSNLGELRNMNYLLKEARGEWFVWLADDDLMHPKFLECAIDMLERCESDRLAAIYSNYTSSANPEGVFPLGLRGRQGIILDSSEFLDRYLLRKINLVGVYGVMRTRDLRMIGGMLQLGNSFSPYSDNLIPVMLSKYGGIGWIDESLIFLRTHPNSLSCSSSDLSAYESAGNDFLSHLDARLVDLRGEGVNVEKIKSGVLSWFAKNEFAVISRKSGLAYYKVIYIFLASQIVNYLPRLIFIYRILHILDIAAFLLGEMFLKIKSRFRQYWMSFKISR